ncbi:sodium-dependent glucose transporter 1A-like [Liolophura sinensis]|uniref:sodium-dependent glucose transporter 1A-like n=1 Tax=Liolophura sinensis TaxID=3198878 RepID=UPI003158CDA4
MGVVDMIMEKRSPTTRKQFQYKMLKTATLIAMWITSGLFNSLAGTTLVDFKEKLDTDFEKLGTVMVFRTVGNMLGCIISCVLRDKIGIQSELIVGITAATCSLVNFLKPWSPSIAFFGVLNFVEGCGQSCANTVNNALLLSLWGSRASGPVHAFHFGFGLGAFLGPLLAKDFLSVRCPDTDGGNNSSTAGLVVVNTSAVLDASTVRCKNSTEDNPLILQKDRLEIPFSVVGSLLALISIGLLTFYFLEKCSGQFRLTFTQPPKASGCSESAEKSPRKSTCTFTKSFFFKFVVGLFFLYMFINTFEGVVYSYLFTFAYEGGTGFSKPEAAYLTSAYWGSYTLSRLLASLIAHFVSVKIMIFVEFVGSLGSLLSMLFLGFSSKAGMWASACLLGVFSAPVWPSGIAWGDRYVKVKASVVAATDVGAGIGGSICMWVAGHLVENKHTRSYLYVATSGCVCAFVVLLVMQIAGIRHRDRHETLSRDDDKSSQRDAPTKPLQGLTQE